MYLEQLRCVNVVGVGFDAPTWHELRAATARRRKERRYPDLSRWSDETRDFLRYLAKAKVRGEGFPVQRAWLLRWRVLLACSEAKAFAMSLLEARSCVSCDGCAPSTGEVVSDARYVLVGE